MRETRITITGATLGAAAAAARLAKLGHVVSYVGDEDSIGGRWRTHLPPTLQLLATWRDLFRKSGRALDAELAKHGLELVSSPPVTHIFEDGARLDLPDERGAQFTAISAAFGAKAAAGWRDLLDDLDDVWLALRGAGIEAPRPAKPDRELARRLLRGQTLADLAARLEPHLGQIVTSLGPRSGTNSTQAPALLATRLVVERTFGRWQLQDDAGQVPATRLLDLLAQRLRIRRVSFDEPSFADAILDFAPTPPQRRFWANVSPALAPSVQTSDVTHEIIRHTAAGVIVEWPGLSYDYTTSTPNLAWGYAPESWSRWWASPAQTSAGNEPWAELANAALRVYSTHHELTGEDVRPTNRDYRP